MNNVIGLDGRYSSGFAPSRIPACGAARLPVAVGLAEEVTDDTAAATAATTTGVAILVRQSSECHCSSPTLWFGNATGYLRPGLESTDAFGRLWMPQ